MIQEILLTMPNIDIYISQLKITMGGKLDSNFQTTKVN